ncbi:unnamed protein product [Clonostachys chloroleuca]|uniref:Uncharacterized protein n=1 Tax=Clonostachys chloroleuca TaxID=1926264 RepID=A0AA35LWK2_9HYPO|nr:unnamed protein product [Clonostachys chloroleuca]
MGSLMEPFSLTAHPYRSPAGKNCAYELGKNTAQNALVFLGGLGDGPHTTPYVRFMARYLETQPDLDYSVFEIRMRSSFEQWGTSSLQEDVEDASALVKYLREKGRNKIILMGHSTGCQDCMEYTNYARHNNEPVDGFILQAPVSDREGLEGMFPEWRDSLAVADQMIAEGKSDWCIPKDKVPPVFNCPMTAYRLRSLIAKGGDDDYFSTDLDDEKVKGFWGRFQKPVLVLHSEKDDFVPAHIDQAALNKRYQEASPMVSQLSGLIPNTGHAVPNEDARQWLSEKVAEFLRALQ